MKGIRVFAIALSCLLLAGQALAQQPWRVYPPTPTAGEPFVLQYDGSTPGGPTTVRNASVSASASTLTFSVDISENDFSVPGAYRASAVVPGVPAGQYQAVLNRTGGLSGPATIVLGTIQVAPAQGPALPTFRGLSGNWFDPNEAGWGVNIVQGDSGALFGVWLTYLPTTASDGARAGGMWLVMPEGRWLSPTQFRGLLYSTVGTSASRPFSRSDLSVTPAGYLSLVFSSAGEVAMKAEAAITASATGGFGLYPPVVKEATIRRFLF